MNLKSLWSALEEAYEPLDSYPNTVLMKLIPELNLPPGWFTWFAAAVLFGAEPITTENYMHLFPYGLARLIEERFASAAQQGYLVAEEGKYRLSENGASVIQQITQAVDEAVAQLQPMSAEKLQQFVNYLIWLADASSIAPEPPTKWLSAYKRNNMNPGKEASLPRLIIYYFDQVTAYRDDVYVATWETHRVEGHAWDMLDKFYSGEALAFDELYEKLKAWGVPQDVYAHDLQELVKRGWVKEESGKYQITPAGKKTREDVEAETERLFFAPWACLSESELEELSSLAGQLRDGLMQ
ncbi:MAG: hypothetical protein HS100_21940 [Anaerolineales bacterium]|nr:hypothetical protein [Anaerolineales bacterium]